MRGGLLIALASRKSMQTEPESSTRRRAGPPGEPAAAVEGDLVLLRFAHVTVDARQIALRAAALRSNTGGLGTALLLPARSARVSTAVTTIALVLAASWRLPMPLATRRTRRSTRDARSDPPESGRPRNLSLAPPDTSPVTRLGLSEGMRPVQSEASGSVPGTAEAGLESSPLGRRRSRSASPSRDAGESRPSQARRRPRSGRLLLGDCERAGGRGDR